MNRRPSTSRRNYDDFSNGNISGTTASLPDGNFFEDRRKMHPGRFFLFVFLIIIAFSIVINLFLNHFVFLHKVTLPITGLVESFDGYKILHISDLKGNRFGTGQSGIRNALRNESFNAVVITGDMISQHGNAEPFYEIIDVLRDLSPDAPIYFIAGDSDPVPASMTYASSGSPFAPWILGARQRKAEYLSSPVSIEAEGQRLWFLSLSQATLDVTALSGSYEQRYLEARQKNDENEIELTEFQLKSIRDTERFRKSISDSDIYIALTHVPSTDRVTVSAIPQNKNYPIDVILSGHYLGGLSRLPFFGALFVPSTNFPRYGLFPGNQLLSGERRIGQTWISISTGLGSTDEIYPPFFMRYFNPPTMSLITLSSSSL